MGKSLFAVCLSAVLALIFWSNSVSAVTTCEKEDENGNCVSYLITDSRLPSDGSSGSGWRPSGGGTGGGGGGNSASAGSIAEKIRQNSCVKQGENCDDFGSRILRQCYAETGLNPAGASTVCRFLANDLATACSTGQVKSCQ